MVADPVGCERYSDPLPHPEERAVTSDDGPRGKQNGTTDMEDKGGEHILRDLGK